MLRAGVYLSLMAHDIYEKRPHKSQMLGDLLSCNSRPWQRSNLGETQDIIPLIAVLICLSKESLAETLWAGRKDQDQGLLWFSLSEIQETLLFEWQWNPQSAKGWILKVTLNNGHYCASFRKIKKLLVPDLSWPWQQCGDHSVVSGGSSSRSWHRAWCESLSVIIVRMSHERRSLRRNLETLVTHWHIACTPPHESRALHVTRDRRALRTNNQQRSCLIFIFTARSTR